jgi:hypothetical protein
MLDNFLTSWATVSLPITKLLHTVMNDGADFTNLEYLIMQSHALFQGSIHWQF